MNIEETAQPNDFAAFEAEAQGKEPEPSPETKPEPKEEPLELGSEEAPEATPEQVEQDKEKKRSRTWQQRVDKLTAEKYDLQRQLEEARKGSGQQTVAPTLDEVMAKEPKAENFEFGSADPDYLEARQDWKLDVRDAKSRADRDESDKKRQIDEGRQETLTRLEGGVSSLEKAGLEKYDDFAEKIEEAKALGPLSDVATIALASIGGKNPQLGADLAYRIASDTATREKLEGLISTNLPAAALMLGEIEGESLSADHDDSDLDLTDQLDQMRLNGRMKARLAGKAGAANDGVRRVTQAPKPDEHRARGSSGQFATKADTTDFAAFEKMANKGK